MEQESKKNFSFFLFLFSFFFLSSLIFNLSSCKRSTEPVYNPQNLQLQVLDVSCTEAWLSLQAKSDYLNKTLKLFKDDKLILEKPLTTEDSLLYVDGLWPNTGYAFNAAVYDGNKLLTRSPAVTATTMDTTSHDFTWQTFEFGGEGGSSSFYDVAIIDDNDIWAVGEIYTADDKYNAAHWDGEKWELRKILFHTFCTNGRMFQYTARSVFFVDNIIFISSGSEITFIKNGIQIKNQCTPVSINKIWGTSSSDLYVVGNSGLIAHYDGQQWQRIESPEGASGTDVDLLDIWGSQDSREIWVCGWRDFQPNVLLKIKGKTAYKVIEKMPDFSYTPLEISGEIKSVWLDSSSRLYVLTRYDVYQCLDDECKEVRSLRKGNDFNWTYFRLRGSALNNVFVIGNEGWVWHYNGLSWYKFTELLDPQLRLRGVAVKNNLVAIVGRRYLNVIERSGIIMIGRR
ncbi:hypothetical protein Calab_1127 [Caldithrix abyssi DSM 13497]|uniref:Glucosyl transferase n=1 Tax=Caldithrix abyssi DSM 13497 TaxID=880073 RepID=H1XWH3_CALAY|nr:hypothetical protein [Caldithrix abyssi]APF20748.1 hypothetical protein Cabys_4003 [Caldithrix abyssi DSM 13497]EHO40755.1 hypothetical protein Calab_1127 [Caldithrix abyssi DSM 13497]